MSEKSTAEVSEVKILTTKVFIVAILLSVFLSVVSLSLTSFLIPGTMEKIGELVGPLNTSIHSLVLSFAFVSLIGILLTKAKIDPRKYALIYSTILVSTIYACQFGYPMTSLTTVAQFRMSAALPVNYGPYLPWWVPPYEVAVGMTTGGVSVPWAAWTAPLLFLWTGAVIWYFLWASLFNVFRRQWIEIEKMDFVWATAHTNVILNIAPKEDQRTSPRFFLLRKRFLVGLIIGAIFELQMALHIMLPWFPAVTAAWEAWPWVAWHPGTLDFGVAIGPAWFESLPGWTGIIFAHPVGFAIAFLAPLEILLTCGIFTFIQGSLIPMILHFMGMVPKPSFPGGGSRYGFNAWYYGTTLGPGNPLLGSTVANFGAYMGLGFFPLIIGGNWRYIVDTFKAVRRGPTKEEIEKEPMPYRWAWIIFIISAILLLIWGHIFLSMDVVAWFLLLIYFGFGQLAKVRIKAAGFNNRSSWDDWMGAPYNWWRIWPGYQGLPVTWEGLKEIYPDPNAVSWFSIKYFWGFKGFSFSNTEMFATQTLVETYKIGADLGVKPRDMFKSVTIASILVMSVSLPLGLWLYYTFGIKPEGLAYIWSTGGGNMAGAWNIPGWAVWGSPLEHGWKTGVAALLSFLTIGALCFLRSHFVWFPLSPVGAVMGLTINSTVIGWGYTFGLTYILKRLVLRIGGAKFIDDWIIPVGVGFIVGYGVGVLLWNIASVLYFFTL